MLEVVSHPGTFCLYCFMNTVNSDSSLLFSNIIAYYIAEKQFHMQPVSAQSEQLNRPAHRPVEI